MTPQKWAPPPLRWWAEHAGPAVVRGLLLIMQKRPTFTADVPLSPWQPPPDTVSQARPRSESVWRLWAELLSLVLALSPALSPITADLDFLGSSAALGWSCVDALAVQDDDARVSFSRPTASNMLVNLRGHVSG